MGTKELEKKSSGGGLVAAWKQNPLVSTGLVLILMIVVQTAIMIYNFGEGSVGELLLSLLTNWLNILRTTPRGHHRPGHDLRHHLPAALICPSAPPWWPWAPWS